MGREADILERAVRTVAQQAAKADAFVDDALAAGLDGSQSAHRSRKDARLELLQWKRVGALPTLGLAEGGGP